jgi:hypothetical protein
MIFGKRSIDMLRFFAGRKAVEISAVFRITRLCGRKSLTNVNLLRNLRFQLKKLIV